MVAARLSIALLLAAPALAAGCDSEPQASTFENTGSVCLVSNASGVVHATVTFPTCLSSSCDTPTVAVCSIKEEDGALRVASLARVKHDGDECTDDCGSLAAECDAMPIAPGTYTVRYGNQTGTVTLPTTGTMVFRSDHGFGECP